MSFGMGSMMVTIGVNTTALTTATKQMQMFAATSVKSIATVSSAMTVMGSRMTTMGKSMTTSLSIPMALIGAGALKMSADFEFSMAKITGLVGVAKVQVDEWAIAIKKLGPELGRSPKELADAMYFITSAGLRGAKAMEVLEMSTRASVAGMGEVKIIADVVTSAMNAYGSENLNAAHATDILTAAVREGKVEADTMAQSMGKVLPVASQMGVSFDQVAASTAAMTRTGTDATTAAIQLRQILNSLQKPSVEAEASMALMGTSAAKLRKTIREDGLLVALQDITQLSKDYGETVFSEVFPNIRAMTGAFDLMGKNAEQNATIFKNLTQVTGDLSKAYESAAATLKNKWDKVLSNIQTTMTDLGETMKDSIIPLFEGFIKKIQQLTEWWKMLTAAQQQNILKWMGFIVIVGPIIAIVGTLISSFGSLIAVIAAVGKALWVMGVAAAANPLLAMIGVTMAAIAAFGIYKNKIEKATVAQKAFNEATENTKKLMATFESLQNLRENLGAMNIRQVGEYVEALQMQKASEEDASLSAIQQQKNILKNNKQYQDALQSYHSETVKWKKQRDLDYLGFLRQGLSIEETDAYKSSKARVKIIDDSIKEASALYKKLENEQKSSSGGTIINREVIKVIQDVAKAEAFLKAKTRELGGEFDATADRVSLYEEALDGMIATHSPQAIKWIAEYKTKLGALRSEMASATDPMLALSNTLEGIENQAILFGAGFDAITPSINAVTATMTDFANKGIKKGTDIEILTDMLADYQSHLPKVTTWQDQLNKTLEDAAFFEGNFGNALSLTQTQIQAQITALAAMRASGEADNETIKKKINLIKVLQGELLGLEIGNQMLQALGSSLTSLATDIGTVLGSIAGSTESMTNVIINNLLKLAGMMLSTAVAAMIMSGAIKGGWLGVLLVGTVGLAALTAVWESSSAKAKGMPTGMAKGGMVPPGYNNDTFPAMLSSNETVIPLDRLNQIGGKEDNALKNFRFVLEGTELIATLDAQTNVNNSY